MMNFSMDEFKKLLTLVDIGEYIKDAVDDMRGSCRPDTGLKAILFSYAKERGWHEFYEEHKDFTHVSDLISDSNEEYIENYNEDEFWGELVSRMARQDYFRSLAPHELKKILSSDDVFLPVEFQDFVEKYENEFEENGIQRLTIQK